ncbi:MAG: transcriptional activator NhaR [Methylotenera sp.]|jgi:LysR family transcriptional activator of nhaA|uniref:transcriptional activator NhaR n=1 Tax=Methylotenera sp. TaxID=2051956 RepID=UPI0027225B55|nr:transcriptional activator NhaR [Methylotenera sp.]MDO9206280.1 transcriptional activator NhaR [Methylotenera sp.]MDO9392747.1 transcriptional activator NhaR [Methylotenera sp.]MDP1521993.1 transcriptional activator NhaR [Methylotenera sp.]MDZ4212644.1 transcriptional activator NhaR [Methylotenera sp.]
MLNYKQLHYFWRVARSGSIARASEQLDLAPQTLSGQIGLLENSLKTTLFRRVGRGLELTETGRLALSYAEEIFEIGAEMEQALSGGTVKLPTQFRVGIADVMPKSIVYKLLAPAMSLAEPIKIICKEDKLERLLADLVIHRLDLVLSDRPMPADINIKGYSHKLVECGVSFFATPTLAKQYSKDFPTSLNQAPLLVPNLDTAMRGRLIRWLDMQRIRPRIVGEFDDSALMKAFGQAGIGIFTAPTMIADEVEHQHGVVSIGQTNEILERFYAISVERRSSHPAVIAINSAAI